MATPLPRRRGFRLALVVLAGGIVGLTIFGTLVWRSTSLEQVPPSDALARFEAVLATLGSERPLLNVDGQGRLTRNPRPAPAVDAEPLSKLHVLAYFAGEERLLGVAVPFWFVQLKGPAAQFLLDGTGFDLEQLGVTPDELAAHGPGLVLDERRGRGDRLVVWTE